MLNWFCSLLEGSLTIMMTITGRHTATMITTTVILQLGKSNMTDLQYELIPHSKKNLKGYENKWRVEVQLFIQGDPTTVPPPPPSALFTIGQPRDRSITTLTAGPTGGDHRQTWKKIRLKVAVLKTSWRESLIRLVAKQQRRSKAQGSGLSTSDFSRLAAGQNRLIDGISCHYPTMHN